MPAAVPIEHTTDDLDASMIQPMTSKPRSGAGSMRPAKRDAGTSTSIGALPDATVNPTLPAAGSRAAPDAGPAAPAMRDAAAPAARCKPGLYAGAFSGSIEVVGLPVSNVNGAVSANLTLDASGQQLEIRHLIILGVDEAGNSVTVELSGNVDCTSFRVENGRLDNGHYHRFAPPMLDFAFVGTAEGTYSEENSSVVGTWSVEAEDTALLGGDGEWTLTLSST